MIPAPTRSVKQRRYYLVGSLDRLVENPPVKSGPARRALGVPSWCASVPPGALPCSSKSQVSANMGVWLGALIRLVIVRSWVRVPPPARVKSQVIYHICH